MVQWHRHSGREAAGGVRQNLHYPKNKREEGPFYNEKGLPSLLSKPYSVTCGTELRIPLARVKTLT